MLPCIAKEANLKQTTLCHKLRPELSSQVFNSLSIMFPFENSIDEASRLLIVFVFLL